MILGKLIYLMTGMTDFHILFYNMLPGYKVMRTHREVQGAGIGVVRQTRTEAPYSQQLSEQASICAFRLPNKATARLVLLFYYKLQTSYYHWHRTCGTKKYN